MTVSELFAVMVGGYSTVNSFSVHPEFIITIIFL
jgi:hypothetical protein